MIEVDLGAVDPVGPAAKAVQPMCDFKAFMLFGSSSSQTLTASEAKPYVIGMGGNDTIKGDANTNLLIGDFANANYLNSFLISDFDSLPLPAPVPYDRTVKGNDSLAGGGGTDILIADQGRDTLNGGDSDDVLVASFNNLVELTFIGGSGNDILFLSDIWQLGSTVYSASKLNLAASQSVERLLIDRVKLQGTANNDLFDFSGLETVESTNFGSDTSKIDLLGGSDVFKAAKAQTSDSLGGISVLGGNGNDTLSGVGGTDKFYGGAGNDSLSGGNGGDFLDGGNDSDIIDGGDGLDSLYGGNGKDTLLGSYGTDVCNGGAGNDSLVGGGGNDGLEGGGDFDYISGGDGTDSLYGGNGHDTLSGEGNSDQMHGGTGKDVFVFNTTPDSATNTDIISDFVVVDDIMHLDNAVYQALPNGALLATSFRVLGSGSVDSSDRIIYDQASGRIYYDADGSGSGAQVQFAAVTAGTVLTAADFFII